MVSKKKLLDKITKLEADKIRLQEKNKELLEKLEEKSNHEEKFKQIFNSLRGLNKKINKHIKGEETKKEEDDKVQDWLKDDRIDEVQDFLNKGVK